MNRPLRSIPNPPKPVPIASPQAALLRKDDLLRFKPDDRECFELGWNAGYVRGVESTPPVTCECGAVPVVRDAERPDELSARDAAEKLEREGVGNASFARFTERKLEDIERPDGEEGLRPVMLCKLCRAGAGGECHMPGCGLYGNRAPDIPVRYTEQEHDGRIENLKAAHGAAQEILGVAERELQETLDLLERLLVPAAMLNEPLKLKRNAREILARNGRLTEGGSQ